MFVSAIVIDTVMIMTDYNNDYNNHDNDNNDKINAINSNNNIEK